MADGILCKHCGYQESDHMVGDESWPKNKGYLKSLLTCSGFKPEDPNLARELRERNNRLTPFELRCLERRAQGNAAWGAYGALMRQQQFNRRLSEYDKAIRKSSGETKRQREQERQKYVKDCKSDTTIHIGFY